MQKRTHSGRGNPENLVSRFSELAHALKGVDLPQDKEGLRRAAEDNNAGDEIMQIIENLPDGKYGTMADVIHAAGEAGAEES